MPPIVGGGHFVLPGRQKTRDPEDVTGRPGDDTSQVMAVRMGPENVDCPVIAIIDLDAKLVSRQDSFTAVIAADRFLTRRPEFV